MSSTAQRSPVAGIRRMILLLTDAGKFYGLVLYSQQNHTRGSDPDQAVITTPVHDGLLDLSFAFSTLFVLALEGFNGFMKSHFLSHGHGSGSRRYTTPNIVVDRITS